MTTERRRTKPRQGARGQSTRTGPDTTQTSPGDSNVVAGFAGGDLRGLSATSMRLYSEWARILVGKSEREVPAKDGRFADPAWHEHPLYVRLAQAYLAFCDAADDVAEGRPHWRGRERARFLTSIITSSLAPTNTPRGSVGSRSG